MKALAIVAVVFSAISLFVPLLGVFLAMACSVAALIAFRSAPTLAGVAFGINIVGTAFLSPSLVAADVISANQTTGATSGGDLYLFYVGWHVALLAVAIVWRIVRGPRKTAAPAT